VTDINKAKNKKSLDQQTTLIGQNLLFTQKIDIALYTLIFGLYPLDRQLYLILVICAFIVLLIKNKQKLSIPIKTLLLVSIIIIFLVPSTFKSLIPSFSIYVSTCWALGLFFFLSLFKEDKKSIKLKLILSLKISFILSVLFIFLTSCYQTIPVGKLPVIDKSKIVHIFFRTENYVASYMTLLLPFSLVKNNSKLLKLSSYTALIISLYLIITGVSQSNIVLCGLILIVWLFTYQKSIFSNKKILLSILVGTVVILIFFSMYQIRSASGQLNIVSEFKGMNERFDLWEATLKLIAENPIVGVGLGNWMISVAKFIDIRSQIVHPHNLYLELGSEISMIALICFILLFIIVIWKKTILQKTRNFLDIACILSLFTYLINSFVYGTINHQYMAFSGITLIAFTVLYILQSDINHNKIFHVSRLASSIAIVFSLAVLLYHLNIYHKIRAIRNLYKIKKEERKQVLLNHYNRSLYSHRTKHNTIAQQLLKKYDLSPEEKRYFTQELAFQYPYDEEYVTNFVNILIKENKFNQAIFHYKNLGFKSNEDYDFLLKLTELYYQNGDIENGDKIINKIREIPNESILSVGMEKFKKIAALKSKAYGLHQKYSK